MQFLNEITELINAQLADVGPIRNSRFALFNIADILEVSKNETGQKISAPFIQDANGEGRFVGPDDINEFSIYHRVDNIQTRPVQKNFGSSVDISMVATMRAIMFVNRKAVKLAPDQLALVTIAAVNIPEAKYFGDFLKSANINITPNGFSLNSYDVFNGEFKNKDYFLTPDFYLIRANYTIDISVSSKCFEIC